MPHRKSVKQLKNKLTDRSGNSKDIEFNQGEQLTEKNNQSSIQSHSIKILNLKFRTSGTALGLSNNVLAKRSLSSANNCGGTISMDDLTKKNATFTTSQKLVSINASKIKSPTIRSKQSGEGFAPPATQNDNTHRTQQVKPLK